MKIYEQIIEYCNDKENEIVNLSEIKTALNNKYGTKPGSIILSDYCYNLYNRGISFDKHLFHYINAGSYKYLGENYPYTGLIFHRGKGTKEKKVVGEWIDGKKSIDEAAINGQNKQIKNENIKKLYEEYNQILQYEMNLLSCKPTELRHLIGRIGEFYCALHTGGSLSKQVNQHGFDVIHNGRRISVKTTAQLSGFISVNQNTFADFDDLFVVQYSNDEFKKIFFGPKEKIIHLAREYDNRYEFAINSLKKLDNNFKE